jgi:hypothetical protein
LAVHGEEPTHATARQRGGAVKEYFQKKLRGTRTVHAAILDTNVYIGHWEQGWYEETIETLGVTLSRAYSMTTTTLKLPEKLKKRVVAVVEGTGQSAHAFP